MVKLKITIIVTRLVYHLLFTPILYFMMLFII